MKNKLFNNSNQLVAEQAHSSTINIENSSVLDIFGVNNENLKYFEPVRDFKGRHASVLLVFDAVENCINELK